MADDIDKDIVPVFIPEKSLVKYGMKLSDDIGHSVATHMFETKAIQEELTALGFMCDFHSVRDRVFAWTLPTMLVVKDEQGLFGENYFWAASEALMQRYSPGAVDGGVPGGEPQETAEERNARLLKEEEERQAEIKLLTYVEPDWRPRPWNSLGSEVEIDQQLAEGRSSRAPISFQLLRARKHFGRKCQFDNVDVKELQLITCNRQIDKNYDLHRICLDGGFQAAAARQDVGTQTSNFRLVNKATVYTATAMSETEQVMALDSPDLQRAVRLASTLVQKAVEQNLIVNVFKDDLAIVDPQEMSLGTKSDHVKFFNTFVDLVHSKNRRITAIDWDRFRPGSVAVSCAQFRTANDRVEVSGNPQPSSVLIWNFNDLIHPEMVLEAPDEVFTFLSNPKAPHLVIGGLANGQLVLWNTNNHRLVAKTNSTQREQDLEGVDHGAVSSIAHVDPTLLSYTEKSHCRPVQNLQWLAVGAEIHKRGDLLACSEPHSIQFASLAGDGYLLFWDIRGDVANNQDQHAESNESDFRWIPVYSVQIHGFNATRMHLWNDPKLSAIYANENGQIALGTWLPRKETANSDDLLAESTSSSVIIATAQAHTLAVNAIQVSTDFPDLVLTVGDWSFAVFRIVDKKKLQKIFVSGCADDYLTDAILCPTRPGVIVTSKANGSLDVWDLCDQSHKPMAHDMMVSSTAISCIQFRPIKYPNVGSQAIVPYLAVGDCGGNLHIIQLPVNFTTPVPNELQIMENFYERERRRFQYFETLKRNTKSV